MQDIQNFNLFGERDDLPDVVHCETIEARSILHDWEFQAHRHAHLHQFLLIESGGGKGMLDEKNYTLEPGMVINVPAGVVHAFSFLPGTHGWVVTLAGEVLDAALRESEGLRSLLIRAEIVSGTPQIKHTIENIFEEYDERTFARAHILRALSGMLAGLVARALKQASNDETRPEYPIQRRFDALIETHYREHLSVADYAGRLAITPTHLSRIMRKATGRPASAAIEDRVIREARRYLAYSNLSIAEICHQLGFSDPAYFSRVFARSTGVSPRSFRAKIEFSINPV